MFISHMIVRHMIVSQFDQPSMQPLNLWVMLVDVWTHVRTGLMSPGLLYRAAIEGVTLALLAGFRSMQAAGMGEAKDLCLVGGGSKNRLWRQVIADAFQLPVRCGNDLGCMPCRI